MNDTLRVDIPPRFCPLPAKTHPDTASMAARGMAWLTGFGFGEDAAARTRMAGYDSAGFYGRIMPDAPAERLQLAVDWCQLMFTVDDHYDENEKGDIAGFASVATTVLRAFDVPESAEHRADDRLLAAVCDLARRGHADGSPTQMRRCVDGHRVWFMGVLWESSWRAHAAGPSIDEYVAMRGDTGGGLAATCWMEIVDALEVPDQEMDSRAVSALKGLSLTTAALDDDLFSYGKDTWFSQRPHPAPRLNVVDVVMAERRCGLEQAMVEVVDICNRSTLRFLELREQVWPRASQALRAYLDHLTYLLPGNIEWGLQAGRYSNPDGRSPGAVVTSASWTTQLPSSEPPPVRSIAWWWDPSTL